MKRPHLDSSLRGLSESVMGLVTQAAGRRLTQVLEFLHEDRIKPLETENKKLRAELEAWQSTFPQYEFDGATGYMRRKPETLPPWARSPSN